MTYFDGVSCPRCGQQNVDYGETVHYDGPPSQPAHCLDCGCHWREEYTLTHADIIEGLDSDGYQIITTVPNMALDGDPSLVKYALQVVANWESGDLAGAVGCLASYIEDHFGATVDCLPETEDN